jgi:transcriptional regulator with XRE-family HTH domain
MDLVLRKELEKRDMKQVDLARALDVPPSTVSDWTRNNEKKAPQQYINVSRADQIANYLELPLEYLLFGTKQDQSNTKELLEQEKMLRTMAEMEKNELLRINEEQKREIEYLKSKQLSLFSDDEIRDPVAI